MSRRISTTGNSRPHVVHHGYKYGSDPHAVLRRSYGAGRFVTELAAVAFGLFGIACGAWALRMVL